MTDPHATQALIEEQLEALRSDWIRQLPVRMQRIRRLCLALIAENGGTAERVEQTCRRLRSLASAASTFGVSEVASRGRRLESMVPGLADPASSDLRKAVEDAIEELEAAGVRAGLEAEDRVPEPRGELSGALRPVPRRLGTRRLAILDPAFEDRHLMQLTCFGFRTSRPDDVAALLAAAGKEPPAAVVCDLESARELARRLSEPEAPELPSLRLVLCEEGSFEARLAAVRAGADAVLVRPLVMEALLEPLDALTEKGRMDPSRVLIVAEDYAAGLHHALTLQLAGLSTEVVTEPLAVVDAIQAFEPDLLLLEIALAGCSGPELAAVVRQGEDRDHLPVVFLSGESDLEIQLAALRLGGDALLPLPTDAENLISAVTSRARASRAFRRLRHTDPLTGADNHSRIHRELAAAVDARKPGFPLAFALLSVDQFRRFNDEQGHERGDTVLRGLARLLRHHLGSEELRLGRWEGDTLSALLSGSAAERAWERLDALRRDFARLPQGIGAAPRPLTLSVGLGVAEDGVTAPWLVATAERALLKARKEGRNRVVSAAEPMEEELGG